MTLFLSHAWGHDTHTHERVKDLSKALNNIGVHTWLDEEHMTIGHLDCFMADGIKAAAAFVVCLTGAYSRKLRHATRSMTVQDNCYKEWTFAIASGKPIIPVALEMGMLDPDNWSDVLRMHLYGLYIVDATGDDFVSPAQRLQRSCRHIVKRHFKKKKLCAPSRFLGRYRRSHRMLCYV